MNNISEHIQSIVFNEIRAINRGTIENNLSFNTIFDLEDNLWLNVTEIVHSNLYYLIRENIENKILI
jgi:hypothetical protein